MKKLEPGQKVKIKEELHVNEAYGREVVVDEMLKYVGQMATVVAVWYGRYRLDIDSGYWLWTDEMLEREEK